MLKATVLILFMILPGFVHAGQFISVCKRSPAMQQYLTDFFQTTCNDITPAQLASLGSLSFLLWPEVHFKIGDFANLDGVMVASFSFHNEISFEPGALADLKSLNTLEFDSSRLNLRAGTLSGLSRLRTLSMKGMRRLEIEPGAFAGNDSLQMIFISSSAIERIRQKVFINLPRLEEVALEGNKRLNVIEDESFVQLPNLNAVMVVGCPLHQTNKAAFRGVPQVLALPSDFDTESADNW